MFNSNTEDNGFQIDENAIDFSFENMEQDAPTVVEKEGKDPKNDTESEEDDVEDSKEDLPDDIFNFEDDSNDDSDDEEFDDLEDEQKDESEKKPTAGRKPKGSLVSTVKLLQEKGFIDVDEDEEITEDSAKDIIEDGFDRAVDNKVGEILGDLDDSRKQMIKYIANGGDINKLSDIVKSVSSITALDVTQEKDQVKIVRQYLKDSEFGDDDEIDAQIDFLKDRGTLEKQAKNFYEKEKAKSAKEEAKLVEEQRKAAEEAKVKARKFKSDLAKVISENEELNDITFTRKDKDLPDYINDQSIKLEGGRTTTPFYKDLYSAMQDPKKLVVLAKLVRTNFDFSNIKNKVITNKTKEIKDNVERVPKKSVNKSSQKRLSDYLDE